MKKSRFSISQVFVYLILLFVIVFFSIMSQSFMTSRNILNICRQVSMIGICSVGMTMVLLTGGIDISVGSIIALSGVVAAKLIAENMWPIFPAMVVGVVIGVICGIISGVMVAKFDVPALIATLAMQSIARGIAFILTQGIPVYGLPEQIRVLGQGYFLNIPIPVYIMVLMVFIGWWLLEQTTFGRHVYAIGGSRPPVRYQRDDAQIADICLQRLFRRPFWYHHALPRQLRSAEYL